MIIDLPEIKDLIKIKLKLDIARKVMPNTTRLTYFPPVEVISNWVGIYLLEKENKIIYVGTTDNLRQRMQSHTYKGDFVYFYPIFDSSQRQMIEMVYKFKYLGRNKI